jgi:hypothetical protein
MGVAATGTWVDPDGVRLPAGEVHAWERGTNQTACGIPLHKARLNRFAHVSWDDVQPETGGNADAVTHVCHRCAAARRGRQERRQGGRSWTRTNPRP